MMIPQFRLLASEVALLKQQRTEYEGLGLHATEKAYTEDMQSLLDDMVPFLPNDAAKTLDIGGGLGGISVALWRAYQEGLHVTVLERDGDHGSKIGWHEKAEDFGAYNDILSTKSFLFGNGVENHTVVDVDKEELPPGPFDVVVSLLSLGFHYPVETYLEYIYANLREGGVLMLDIRHGTDGRAKCFHYFGNCQNVRAGKKSSLFAFVK